MGKPFNRPDFSKWMFRINLLVTGIVFFLLTPTVRVYRDWFPDKKDSLWFYSLGVMLISAALWFLASISIPALIRAGVLKDLRKNSTEAASGARFEGWERYRKILMPIAVTLFHLLLMLVFLVSMIGFLQTEPFKKLLTNLP